MSDAIRVFIRPATAEARLAPDGGQAVRGPLSFAEVRAALDAGHADERDELRPEGWSTWLPASAWVVLTLDVPPPAQQLPQRLDMPPELAALEIAQRSVLRWWLSTHGAIHGPIDGDMLAATLRDLDDDVAQVALVGGDCWFPRAELERTGDSNRWRAAAASTEPAVTCAVCLEVISADAQRCPECGELPHQPLAAPPSSAAPTTRPASIPDDPPDASWLRMHWRPLVTMSAMGALIAAGVALRYLAPHRYEPPQRMSPQAAQTEPVCDTACWHGEACQMGKCVWQAPNDMGHVKTGFAIAGPFDLPSDVSDVLPLDRHRFALSHLAGVRIVNAQTGGEISLVSDAPHAQQLYRVDDVVYASAPRRIYVIGAKSTRVLKTIELGSSVGDLAVGASGRRVLATIPGLRAVAVIATDFHAEVSRFYFGDDAVRAIALDDTGSRALTTNGRVPLAGLPAAHAPNRLGAMYAFDPSRLPSEQDRVRTAMVGNPVDVAMTPDTQTSYGVLREKDRLVQLERLPSGAIRQHDRLQTCRQPEQIELVRRGRRLVVRCNIGRAVEVFDASSLELVRRVPLNARVTDMAITPDGEQAILVLPREKGGAVALLDLETYEVQVHELNSTPNRVRMAPDGRTAVVISDQSKVAWVIR